MPAATTLAMAGISLAGSTASFVQAGQQQEAIKKANLAAEAAMQEARKILDVNVYEGLGIDQLPFDIQREDLAALGGQALTAAQESERGAAGVAGNILKAVQEQERQISATMSQQLSELEKLTAQEESRLQESKVGLELGEIAGAQQAAMEAERTRNAAIASGIQNLADFGLTLYSGSELYKKSTPKDKNLKKSKGYGNSGNFDIFLPENVT